jgi:hypothetical protein
MKAWKAVSAKFTRFTIAASLLFSFFLLPAGAEAIPNPGGAWTYFSPQPSVVTLGDTVRINYSFTPDVDMGPSVLLFSPSPSIGPGQPLQPADADPPFSGAAGQILVEFGSNFYPRGVPMSGWTDFQVNGVSSGTTINLTGRFALTAAEGEDTFNPETSTAIQVQSIPTEPLGISVAPNASSVAPGNMFVYHIVVSNPNSQAAYSVVASDQFDAYLDPQISPIGGPIRSGNTLIWNLHDSIPPYGSVPIDLTVRVLPNAPGEYSIGNSASVTSANYGPNSASSIPVIVNATPPPSSYALSITVNQGQVAPGGIFRYTITLQNGASYAVTQPLFEFALPPNTNLLGTSSAGVLNGNRVQWYLGTIVQGQTVQLTADLQVAYGIPASTVINATAHFNGRTQPGYYVVDTNSAAPPVTVSAPQFTITHAVNPPNAPGGGTVAFTVVIKNGSNSAATSCQLQYTLNPHLLNPVPNPMASGQSGNVYTWNLGYINAGQQITVNINLTIDPATTVGQTLSNAAVLTIGSVQYSASAGVYVSQIPPPPIKGFPDLPSYFWAYDEITALVKGQIINGYPDDTFKPNNAITRAEFAKMILLSMGYQPPLAGTNIPVFPDLTADDMWANTYIMGAVQHHLMQGYPDGSFRPRNSITMAEVLTVIVRAQQWPLVNTPAGSKITIHDLDNAGPPNYVVRPLTSQEWFYQYVGTAIAHRIISFPDDPHITAQGPDGDSYMAYFNSPCNRAQTAVFDYRILAVHFGS